MGEYDVLVDDDFKKTALIFRNANTIIVNNAAFFGLHNFTSCEGVLDAPHNRHTVLLYSKVTQKLTQIQEKRLRAIWRQQNWVLAPV